MKGLIFSVVLLCGLLYTPVLSKGLRDVCHVMKCASETQCRVVFPVGSSTPSGACIPNEQLPQEETPACYKDRIVFDVTGDGVYSVLGCASGSCPDGADCARQDGGTGICCSNEQTEGFCPPKKGGVGVCGGPGLGCSADTDIGCQMGMKCCEAACGGTMCQDPVQDKCGGCASNQDCVEKQVQCVRAPCPPVYGCVDKCGECPKNQVCKEKDVQCITAPCDPVYECQDRCGGCKDDQVCKEKEVQCITAPCDPVYECQDRCGGCKDDEVCKEKEVQCFAPPCDPVYECQDRCGGCRDDQVCKEKEVQCVAPPCDPVYECQDRCGGCKDDEICVNDSPLDCSSPDCESFACKPDKCGGECTGESLCSVRKPYTCKECSPRRRNSEKCAFRGSWCVGLSRNWCWSAYPIGVRDNVDVVCPKPCREDERCVLFPVNCRFWRCQVEPRCVKLLFF